MKKLMSLLIVLAIVISTVSVSLIANADELNQKIADTSDFSLSSIEFTEKMLVGYNIGNALEMTELRSTYVRPDNISDFNYYKETLAGNVPITEDFIKYLKSIGVQAVRLPVTWFNMLEDEKGNIDPKNTWYASLETRQNAWYNGKINADFMARVKQIVDWIIGNDMYCILNSHHDGVANNANAINPVRFGTYNEQAIKFLTNIWGQIGEYFKDYGSKLIFEPYNEVADETGSMSPSDKRNEYTAEVLRAYITQIRSQGSNNANRFIVCPAYGGVSFWNNIDGFKNSDTATDKLIITTHSYQNSGSVEGAIKTASSRMTKLGVGAIIDEVGNMNISSTSEESVKIAANIRKYSEQYKVSCFWWDNGAGDFSIINRKYLLPSSEALGAYVGKELEYKTYTQSEAIALTASTQSNWVKLYTDDSSSTWAGKYLLVCSQNKIKTLDKSSSSVSQGYYTFSGADNGLLTYFTSDDGVNYKLMHTIIPTDWAKVAWNMFKIYGSSYYTKQVDGNYKLEKIGDGLQNYKITGDNLISKGGNWIHGNYSLGNGEYQGIGKEYYNARICLENKIAVLPNECYFFSLLSGSATRYQYIIRLYNTNGTYISNIGTLTNGAVQMPSDAGYVSVSVFDSQNSASTVADALLGYISDGTFAPKMYHYIDSETTEDPTSPTTVPTTGTTVPTITTTAPVLGTAVSYGVSDMTAQMRGTDTDEWQAAASDTISGVATYKISPDIAKVGSELKLSIPNVLTGKHLLQIETRDYYSRAYYAAYINNEQIGSEISNISQAAQFALHDIDVFTTNTSGTFDVVFKITQKPSADVFYISKVILVPVISETTTTVLPTTAITTQPTVPTTSVIIPTTVTTTTLPTTVPTTSPQILFGDASGDGVVNTKDVLLMRKKLAGFIVDINVLNSDINSDSVCNAKDLLLLRKYLAGMKVSPWY